MQLKRLIKECLPARLCLTRRRECRGKIALTFDDGPHPEGTKQVLGALERRGVQASFFMSGSEIERFPALAARVRRYGHEIGNHAYAHEKIAAIGFEAYRRGVERTSILIERATGAPCVLFRPPYGELSLRLLHYALRRRMTTVLWSADSGDSSCTDAAQLRRHVRDLPLRDGDILLLHDDYPATAEAVDGIIADARERGFSFITVSQMLESV